MPISLPAGSVATTLVYAQFRIATVESVGRVFATLSGVLLASVAGYPLPASAFQTASFEQDGTLRYVKWGDNTAGSPSVITWSLIPDGTPLDPAAPAFIQGTSNLTGVFHRIGGRDAALRLLDNAFSAWGSAANVSFVFVGEDDATPWAAAHAPGQQLGDIRIGAYEIDGFSAAVGFLPPPNGGTTLEGDILFNARGDIAFYDAPEAEGELYDLFPPGGGLYRNEFTSLFAHELGHALGLLHSDVPEGLMCGFVEPAPGFDGSQCVYFDPDGDGRAPVNRLPDLDDINGIHFLYGVSPGADFDRNGRVDGADLLVWQRGFLNLSQGESLRESGDANGNGLVNTTDLQQWEAQFGNAPTLPPTISATVTIPEPPGFLLAGMLPFWRRARGGRPHSSRG